MNLPGHNITMEEYNSINEAIRKMSLQQIDLMSERTKKRHYSKVLEKATDEQLISALSPRGYRIEKI